MRLTTLTWEPGAGWTPAAASPAPQRPDATLALAFVDPLVDAEDALAELEDALPGCTVIACSTAGQILGHTIDAHPVVAAVLEFETGLVHAVCALQESNSETVGRELGESLLRKAGSERIAGVLVFGCGLDVNGQGLADGMAQALPPETGIYGGLAGDGDRFERTWVRCNGQTLYATAAAVLITGDAQFRSGARGGWDGFGPKRTITSSDGNVLHELDGQPALGLYKQYLGQRAHELPSSAMLFPLSVSAPDGDMQLVRTVLSVDEEQQTMTFAGDVPTGWSGRLMWTTKENLLEAAAEAAQESTQGDSEVALVISCVGRRLVLGARTEEELEYAMEELGGIPVIGFYSYGEISPMDKMIALQNQTMTITTIRESGSR